MRRPIFFGLAAGAMCLFLTTGVRADTIPIGTQNFVDIGVTTAGGSPTGNINTATTFMLGDLISGAANSGVLAGLPTQNFGALSFSLTSPTSLSFGDTAFGTFSSTSITTAVSTPGFLNVVALGNWAPGTFGGVTGGPFPSEFRLAFSQTPADTGTISAGGTFATPPVIPEPSSIAMVLTGLATAVGFGFRRRRSQS